MYDWVDLSREEGNPELVRPPGFWAVLVWLWRSLRGSHTRAEHDRDVIYETRETVFHNISKHRQRRVENTTRSGVLAPFPFSERARRRNELFFALFPSHPLGKETTVTQASRGVFFTKFEVFGNVMKHCLEYLIWSYSSKELKWRNKIVKNRPSRDYDFLCLISLRRIPFLLRHIQPIQADREN